MRYLKSVGRWSLIVVAFMAIGFTGRTAAAWHAYESGDAFLDIDYQIQARQAWSDINSGSSDVNKTSNFYLRRSRFSFLGAVNETYGYALQLEYVGGQKIHDTQINRPGDDYTLSVLDAYLQANYGDALNFRAGRTKHLLTREVSEGCFDPLTLDRSSFVSGPFNKNKWSENKTTRDMGVTAMGNLFNNVFQYRLGVMQGNKYTDAIKPDNIGYRYTGRVHVSLLDPESGWGYKGSYLGKKKVLTLGAGYEMEPKAVYASYDATNLVGSGSQDYTAYTYDAFFEYPTEMGTTTLSAAYLKQDFGDAGVRMVPGTEGDFNGQKDGYYTKAAYMLGKWQVYGRMERWKFASLGGVIGQSMNWASEGINYYINGQDLRLTLEAQQVDFVKPGSTDFNTVILQFQARI